MARTIELSEGTGRLLDLKRQLEEVVNNITSYFGDSRYLVGIGIYFGKPKKKETFIYNSS